MNRTVNKKYKDRLFRMVFQDKEDLLSLYNAIAGTDYHKPEELEIATIEDVIYLCMKNDIAFFLDHVLNLYEHQSSFNPNMPIRGMFYAAEEYKGYIEKSGINIYGSRLIKLPAFLYIVFYNGLKDQPDRMILKLSDAFYKNSPILESCLECKAIMLNINLGHNQELMKNCKKLHEYAQFIAKVRETMMQVENLDQAIHQAVTFCVDAGILADFLSKHRAEVSDMILTEYDEQRHIAFERAEAWEEAWGEAWGEAWSESTEKGIEILISTCQDLEIPYASTMKQICARYNLAAPEAETKMNTYWK